MRKTAALGGLGARSAKGLSSTCAHPVPSSATWLATKLSQRQSRGDRISSGTCRAVISGTCCLGALCLRSQGSRARGFASRAAPAIAKEAMPPITTGHFVQVRDGSDQPGGGEAIRLHYAECLPPPEVEQVGLCILLHGFPDFHGSWRDQMPFLATNGYRVIAPDMRGYGKSSKPPAVENYSQDELTADIAALVAAVSPDKPVEMLCGHDWGAFVAYAVASDYPGLCKRLAILNVPHARSFEKGLQTWQQMLKSWYIFIFQLPVIPELVIEFGSAFAVRTALQWDMNKSQKRLPPEVLQSHAEVFAAERWVSQGPINYYRAALCGLWGGLDAGYLKAVKQTCRFFRQCKATRTLPPKGGGLGDDSVAVPVKVIWGVRDAYLGQEMADPPLEWVPQARPTLRLEAGHWVHWAMPEEVNTALLEFLHDE